MAGRTSTATTRAVSQVNRTALLEALRSGGPMTLQDLQSSTGLSPATVNRLVDAMRRDGLIVDVGVGVSTGGRPPRLIGYNARASSVIAVDLGARTIKGVLYDLSGAALAVRTVDTGADSDAASGPGVFDRVAELAERLVATGVEQGSPARAVAVGVPGTVRTDTGMVEFAPSLRWWDMPLAELLTERLGVPVVVENDVNLRAVAEHRLGAGRGMASMAVVAVGTGVGAGLVIGGELFRGAQGGAGEIGYMLLDRSSVARPWPGFGDLESRIGGPALARRAADAGLAEPKGGLDAERVLARVRAGDRTANEVFRAVVDEVAMAVANLAVVLNPEAIILAGGVGDAAADLLLPAVRARLAGRIPLVPKLVAAEVPDGELRGAAQLAVESSEHPVYLTSQS
ncbi:ROK family transcriptional regulator [Actinocatenispora rupis]|uniref:Sugar kinase n=1 Tax=Actinocatenispora rupis TaxID=519421 RepID=A0A8J3JCE7_9ACTN|nr:ROK family transcriptional regulator [Actinocatenispora rupis]GID12258.1 sugar kinase [Actinocatenispora rupis]